MLKHVKLLYYSLICFCLCRSTLLCPWTCLLLHFISYRAISFPSIIFLFCFYIWRNPDSSFLINGKEIHLFNSERNQSSMTLMPSCIKEINGVRIVRRRKYHRLGAWSWFLAHGGVSWGEWWLSTLFIELTQLAYKDFQSSNQQHIQLYMKES